MATPKPPSTGSATTIAKKISNEVGTSASVMDSGRWQSVNRLLGIPVACSRRRKRLLSQRFDLRRCLGAAVGDDLFQDPHALFQLHRARCILRSFFRGEAVLAFQLLFLPREEAPEDVCHEDRRYQDDDQQAE